MLAGHLRGLAVRPPGSPAPQAVQSLRLAAGAGIEGDRHADALSPRQVLLADVATYRDFGLAPLALRENLLLDLDLDLAGLASGSLLQIGADAAVRVMFVCEACGQLDRHGVRLAARIGNRRGMLARVLRGGEVRCGDPVAILEERMAPWPDDWRVRVARVLEAAPPGHVVEYARLAHLAGIQSSYCRAFTRLLSRLGPDYRLRAIPARALTDAPRWDGSGLFEPEPA